MRYGCCLPMKRTFTGGVKQRVKREVGAKVTVIEINYLTSTYSSPVVPISLHFVMYLKWVWMVCQITLRVPISPLAHFFKHLQNLRRLFRMRQKEGIVISH